MDRFGPKTLISQNLLRRIFPPRKYVVNFMFAHNVRVIEV